MNARFSASLSPARLARTQAGALAMRVLAAMGALALAAASPARAHAEEPAAASTALVIDSAPWDLDPEDVRAAIARELGGTVTLEASATPGRPALVLRSEPDRRVTLTYQAEDGRRTGRTIDLPDDPDRAAETIALLAANLARDEAAELAAALGKRPSPAPAEPPPEAAEPPPEAAAPPPAKPSPVKPRPAKPASQAKPDPAKPDPAPGPTAADHPCWRLGLETVVGGGDVLPLVGTSTTTGTNVVRSYSANLIAGYTAGLTGVELSAGANIEHTFMCGAQISNVANIVSGPVRGMQLTGVINVGTSVFGAQGASINVAAGPLHGLQVGGVDISGPLRGAQIGGINIAAGSAVGTQIGGINVSGDFTGVQMSAVNIANGDTTGVQIGAINVSTGRLRGAQIGLINYADRSSFSFGLVNIVPKGRVHLEAWGQESGIVMAGVEHGGDHFHNIYGVGARLAGDRVRPALTLGYGVRIPVVSRIYVDVDALGYTLHEPPSFAISAVMAQVRALVAVRLLPKLAIYAGPSYSFSYAFGREHDLSPYGSLLVNDDPSEPVRAWPGLSVGVRVF
ncbi:LA_2272 family surface repeat-containing protein [Polyangium aurulentum]|uniref:LA_2272 family surface repeat-containing protein n=1 Tax=Polyangium aurulentum TaxID=2567896 RepID=UPI0010AE50BA|nr:hypothetical protein [Polyangium aurulentum]UQA62254.1 hypothetical protein E8A73_017990 [Polyangium aurulentum]